jgi:DNA-binding phage protein
MLEVVARYQGMNKSATLVSLVRREFWRAFPGGTDKIRPDRGAKVEDGK